MYASIIDIGGTDDVGTRISRVKLIKRLLFLGGLVMRSNSIIRLAQVEKPWVQITMQARFFKNPTHNTFNTVIGNYHESL